MYAIPPVNVTRAHPSDSASGGRGSASDVHNEITHGKEHRSRQRLCEEISQIINRANKRHADLMGFHALAHEEMAALDVLHTLVLLVVIGAMDGRLIINSQLDRLITVSNTELTKEA